MRENEHLKQIEPFVRSLKMFKPYADYETGDMAPFLQDISLHKFKTGERIFDAEEPSDRVYVVLAGRIAVAHASNTLLEYKLNPKVFKERVQYLTTAQKHKLLKKRTFVTREGGYCEIGDDHETYMQQMKTLKLEEAKAKHSTFLLFDKMLGIEENPKLV